MGKWLKKAKKLQYKKLALIYKLENCKVGACPLSDCVSRVWEWLVLRDKLHTCPIASSQNDPLRPSIICQLCFHFSWFIGPAMKLMCVTYINPFSIWLNWCVQIWVIIPHPAESHPPKSKLFTEVRSKLWYVGGRNPVLSTISSWAVNSTALPTSTVARYSCWNVKCANATGAKL